MPRVTFTQTIQRHVECPPSDVAGATEDELVANVEAHLASDHPEMAGKYSREQILAMAHEH